MSLGFPGEIGLPLVVAVSHDALEALEFGGLTLFLAEIVGRPLLNGDDFLPEAQHIGRDGGEEFFVRGLGPALDLNFFRDGRGDGHGGGRRRFIEGLDHDGSRSQSRLRWRC